MTRVIFDERAIASVRGVDGVVEVCGEGGRVVGYFQHAPLHETKSPFTREQIEEFRKQRMGRPLSEILSGLEGR